MINQFQLLILLPLIIHDFNKKVKDFILNMDVALFSFNFIPNDYIPFYSKLNKCFDFEQKNTYLKELKLESGSSLISNLNLISVILCILLLHILLMPFY